jgi:enoyl-CoA hydratase
MTIDHCGNDRGVSVIFEKKGFAGWVRINRPAELNTITPQVLNALDKAMDETEADPTLAALVLTGTGRAFCAGADLKFVADLPAESRGAAADAFIAQVLTLMDRLEAFSKPVIAAVNGIATGGGMELVLCCDLVMATSSARLGDGHANYGLLPGGGGSVRLPRKIGPTRAKYLFFSGELLPASELVAAGLVNQVTDEGDLEAEVLKLVGSISRKSPLALSRMKQLADASLEQTPVQGMLAERTMSALHAMSYDCQEGVRAFNEKRKPVFLGR